MNYFNLETETNLLGSILNKNDVLLEIQLEPNDLYDSRHQIIYKAMQELYFKNKPIDITTLAAHLKGTLKEVGGITYLSQIMGSIIDTKNAKTYAEIIKENSNKRMMYKNLNLSIKELEDGTNVEDIKATLQDELYKITTENNDDTGEIEKALEETLKDIEKAYQNGGSITGVSTHYRLLDKTLNGLNGQDFIILAARPSMGKSAFALNLFGNVALRSKAHTALFSLEMSKKSMYKRLLSIFAGVELDKIKKGKLSNEEWAEVTTTTGFIAQNNKKIRVFEKVMTLDGIKAECKKMKQQSGLDVVIIDYLQLIRTKGKQQSREQEVSNISRDLKLMAKDLDCTVIALSQLSRAPEQRADHRPMLSDLRESGSIEQDADIVMFLYRDEYYHEDTEKKGIIECIVAKNRDGELGTIDFTWIPQLQRISE